ncbi:hypothetical protein [Burkholderia cepacia]|uniref:hypothetical protein n=1 Tax=Burkholderia cepacia TaxID=292 RepID=UPI00158BF5AC|nr:hypothetical protein [Burkholderia cepacia]
MNEVKDEALKDKLLKKLSKEEDFVKALKFVTINEDTFDNTAYFYQIDENSFTDITFGEIKNSHYFSHVFDEDDIDWDESTIEATEISMEEYDKAIQEELDYYSACKKEVKRFGSEPFPCANCTCITNGD